MLVRIQGNTRVLGGVIGDGGSGPSPSEDVDITIQVDADALDAWSAANPARLTDNMVALLINDDVGESEWLQYDTSIPDWKYLDAGGVFVVDGLGEAVSLRKVELSPEFEVTSAPENPGIGVVSVSKFMKNTAPVTTFLVAQGLSRVVTPGGTVDIFEEFFASFTESFIAATGAELKNFANDPFTAFLTEQGRIRFHDIDTTTEGVLDIREVAVSCRLSGTFGGGLDSAVLVDYYQITQAGALDVKVGTMAFERQFQLDFDARAQSLVSRLSKQTSTLVQNGAKFILSLPSGAPGSFTINEIDFLITVGG